MSLGSLNFISRMSIFSHSLSGECLHPVSVHQENVSTQSKLIRRMPLCSFSIFQENISAQSTLSGEHLWPVSFSQENVSIQSQFIRRMSLFSLRQSQTAPILSHSIKYLSLLRKNRNGLSLSQSNVFFSFPQTKFIPTHYIVCSSI